MLKTQLDIVLDKVVAAGRAYFETAGGAFVRGVDERDWADWKTRDAALRSLVDEARQIALLRIETGLNGNPFVMKHLDTPPNRALATTGLGLEDLFGAASSRTVALNLRELAATVREVLSSDDELVADYLRTNVVTCELPILASSATASSTTMAERAFLLPILTWLKTPCEISERDRMLSLLRGESSAFYVRDLDVFYGRLALFRKTLSAALACVNREPWLKDFLHVGFFTATSRSIEDYFLGRADNGFALRASMNPARVTMMLRLFNVRRVAVDEARSTATLTERAVVSAADALDCVNICAGAPSSMDEVLSFKQTGGLVARGWDIVAESCVEHFEGPQGFVDAVLRAAEVLVGWTGALSLRSTVERKTLRTEARPFCESYGPSVATSRFAEDPMNVKRKLFMIALTKLAPVVSLEALFVDARLRLDFTPPERRAIRSIQTLRPR